MVASLDVYRAANVLLRRHGADARLVAAMRADRFAEQGVWDGYRLWLAVAVIIDELQNDQIPPNSSRH